MSVLSGLSIRELDWSSFCATALPIAAACIFLGFACPRSKSPSKVEGDGQKKRRLEARATAMPRQRQVSSKNAGKASAVEPAARAGPPDVGSRNITMEVAAVAPVAPAIDQGSSFQCGAVNTSTDIFIDETRLSEEGRKTFLKLRKKLREIAQIEARIAAGEPVEPNQLAKAALRPELEFEFASLVEGIENGIDASFVTVTSGKDQGHLRSEAARRVEYEAAAAAPSGYPSGAVTSLAPKAAPAPKKKTRQKKSKAEKEEESWTVVGENGRPLVKKQVITEEERAERKAALLEREACRVLDENSVEYARVHETLGDHHLLDDAGCQHVEAMIQQVVSDARRGMFKRKTVDMTPMRNKYFFGFGYTYGAQRDFPGAHGQEAVWPPDEVDPIPDWIQKLLIEPLERRGIVPKNWVNSATINDYAPGGCIVAHIDPPHLFDRPIVGVNLVSDCNLVFGTSFQFPSQANDIACSTPVYVHRARRGWCNALKGYSANGVTHAIRPVDCPQHRTSIILRRVLPTAPVLLEKRGITVALRDLPRALRDSAKHGPNVDSDSDSQGSEFDEWGRVVNIHKKSLRNTKR